MNPSVIFYKREYWEEIFLMILLANDEKKKNVLFINDNFLTLPLLNKNLNLERLLFPDKKVGELISDVELYYVLLEINLSCYNRLPDSKQVGYNFDNFTEETKLLLNNLVAERPHSDGVKEWLNDTHEFYVKSSDTDVIVCISTTQDALTHGFTKMQADNIKEAFLELFYSQFTYYDIHNLSRPNKDMSEYEITVAKAFELGLK